MFAKESGEDKDILRVEEAKRQNCQDVRPLITFLTSKRERWRRAGKVKRKKCYNRLPSCLLPPEERKVPDVCAYLMTHDHARVLALSDKHRHTQTL